MRRLVRAGLLRRRGLRVAENFACAGRNALTVRRRFGTHDELVRRDSGYADCAAAIFREALAIDWTVEPRPRDGGGDTGPGTLGGAKGITR